MTSPIVNIGQYGRKYHKIDCKYLSDDGSKEPVHDLKLNCHLLK
jgi:hypothetical protein